MISSACFRSSNTLRVTLPTAIRRALALEPRHRVIFTQTAPGVVEIRNADAIVNAAITAKRK